jgi:hypothetical protein
MKSDSTKAHWLFDACYRIDGKLKHGSFFSKQSLIIFVCSLEWFIPQPVYHHLNPLYPMNIDDNVQGRSGSCIVPTLSAVASVAIVFTVLPAAFR